ncbi:hypothetical protein GOB86_07230 [Acetobacter lambici]|uniref:Uncharacterized protein n=1 Tax=Acetobacter lambici TaxID=1332824 RepID=A0ABT1F391_9PROT|nr:hypothetical protein [Acetobacter lambici]MCP1242376.1 hypothetical protein [Acetobacter lambici]MCP1258598.1 hypothetical protein [Acetobacter lambici]NHO56857.1 hypothetical protein [Acetobacter lambici]
MPYDLTRLRSLLPRVTASGALAVGLLTALTDCGGGESASMEFAPACPITHIPSEAADYYLYKGKSTDYRDLVARASIVKLEGDCLAGGPKDLKTRVVLHITVERGPASTTEALSMPWFIAVLHGDRIVNKHIFRHTITFPANLATFDTTTKLITIDLPIPPRNVDSDYRFEVGFQLSRSQLEYNQTHLKRATYQAY